MLQKDDYFLKQWLHIDYMKKYNYKQATQVLLNSADVEGWAVTAVSEEQQKHSIQRPQYNLNSTRYCTFIFNSCFYVFLT